LVANLSGGKHKIIIGCLLSVSGIRKISVDLGGKLNISSLIAYTEDSNDLTFEPKTYPTTMTNKISRFLLILVVIAMSFTNAHRNRTKIKPVNP